MLEQLTPVRSLREGGEGRVVLCYDPALSRWLAVKLVALEADARPLGDALLAKLAAFAKDMLEPAVVPILESGLLEPQGPIAAKYGLEPGLYLYIVMPYVHGLPAHELARGPLGAKEAAALFVAGAKLLARLHAQGLVHLDLKPANVLVDVQGRVVLVDPLLALVQGTNAYAAHEADLGPPADRYALGRLVAAAWTDHYPTSQRDGLPELPEPSVQLSGKARLAHGRFKKLLEQLAGAPEGREIDLVAAEAIADDLGATDGAAVLAKQVARSPFHATLAEIEKAQKAPRSAGGASSTPCGPRFPTAKPCDSTTRTAPGTFSSSLFSASSGRSTSSGPNSTAAPRFPTRCPRFARRPTRSSTPPSRKTPRSARVSPCASPTTTRSRSIAPSSRCNCPSRP